MLTWRSPDEQIGGGLPQVQKHKPFKNSCLSNYIAFVLLLYYLNTEAETPLHVHTNTHTHTGHKERKRSKMRSRERRSLKFQGDTREERRASSSSSAGLPSNRPPHQYENEPAVTVAAVRLPWHFGCLEDVQLQGMCVRGYMSLWKHKGNKSDSQPPSTDRDGNVWGRCVCACARCREVPF